jgi:CheY-like chemotaxis protein
MRSLSDDGILTPMAQRTLIVDDNPMFQAAAKSLLHGAEFAIVDVVANSADALERVKHGDLDLVLLDIDLGEENGFVLAREISECLDGGAPKIVMISAHPGDDFADMIAASPAVGFLPKSELSRASLTALLQRS